MKLQQAYRGGYKGRPGWWLHLSYDEEGVEILKSTVPAPLRTWDEEAKRWWVAAEAESEALKVIPSLEAFIAQAPLL